MSTILGIESIVKNGKVLVNVKKTYTVEKGGIIPVDAAKHHRENGIVIYNEALEKAKEYGVTEDKIDGIAFSQGPGLAPCLLEGLKFAKGLSKRLKKPLIPVNHCVAHLEVGKITGAKDPVLLYTSGANTQVIAYSSGKYRVFGETLDVGVGNFIDTFARYAGIGFPGGPVVEKFALKGKENYENGETKLIELPYSVKGMDIALSGILTNLKQKLESKKYSINDLSFSLQETVFAMLVEVAERALAHTGKKELLLGGGVACNSRLQEMCKIMCGERNCKFFCPERSLLVDNGAMIGYLGEIIFESANKNLRETSSRIDKIDNGKKQLQVKYNNSNDMASIIKNNQTDSKLIYYSKDLDNLDILPRQRTDDVNVSWR
jgi:N6-L-threonylcarbamoyladenine synthase